MSAGPYRLGLTGYPLDHSLSPRLHAAALEACGLEGEYRLYPVPPGDDSGLRELVESVRREVLHGLNVTIPHKRSVLPLLDEVSQTAQTIGAVNTIYARDGALVGENTDNAGFLSDLGRRLPARRTSGTRPALDHSGIHPAQEHSGTRPALDHSGIHPTQEQGGTRPAPDHSGIHPAQEHSGTRPAPDHSGIHPAQEHSGTRPAPDHSEIHPAQEHSGTRPAGLVLGSALILGCGGSARGVVYALLQAGWQVSVAARRVEQAQELRRAISADVEALELNSEVMSRLVAERRFDLVVNATPLGMGARAGESPWPAGVPLPGMAFVYDLVYNPPETTLMRLAREAGLACANGLGMLIDQARLAFKLWTGCEVEREVMERAVKIGKTTESQRARSS